MTARVDLAEAMLLLEPETSPLLLAFQGEPVAPAWRPRLGGGWAELAAAAGRLRRTVERLRAPEPVAPRFSWFEDELLTVCEHTGITKPECHCVPCCVALAAAAVAAARGAA